VTGNEESFTEQQLRDRLRHLDSCIKAVSSCRAVHDLPSAKRDGVEQLLDYLCRVDMISRVILRIKLYGRMTNTCLRKWRSSASNSSISTLLIALHSKLTFTACVATLQRSCRGESYCQRTASI
jgi:hypothetical protein